MPTVPREVAARIRRNPETKHHVVEGSTPVPFFGNQPEAQLATVGINPSRIEFQTSRSRIELDGPSRRFETLKSLGINSNAEADDAQVAAIYERCIKYFDDTSVAYWDWFKRLEWIIQPLASVSYTNGSACHLDLVQWATDPVWSGIKDHEVRTNLAAKDLEFLLGQLAAPQLRIAYLNGAQVATVLGSLIPIEDRRATFRDGTRWSFYKGHYEGTAIVGCSAFIQNAHIRTEDKAAFNEWIAAECRRDLDALD